MTCEECGLRLPQCVCGIEGDEDELYDVHSKINKLPAVTRQSRYRDIQSHIARISRRYERVVQETSGNTSKNKKSMF